MPHSHLRKVIMLRGCKLCMSDAEHPLELDAGSTGGGGARGSCGDRRCPTVRGSAQEGRFVLLLGSMQCHSEVHISSCWRPALYADSNFLFGSPRGGFLFPGRQVPDVPMVGGLLLSVHGKSIALLLEGTRCGIPESQVWEKLGVSPRLCVVVST